MKTFDDLFNENIRNNSLIAAAKKAGVAALLLLPITAAIVDREHADRLARFAAKGEVRVRLDLQNKIGVEYESQNVVPEIRGREKRDEVVFIGARLDSWDLGAGAEDNRVNGSFI